MKLDTSTYYPKSTLGEEEEPPVLSETLFPKEAEGSIELEGEESTVTEPEDHNEELEPDVPATTAERIATGISRLLSWVLVPLLMPVYGILLAFDLSILSYTSDYNKVMFTCIVALITVLLPAILVMLLKRMGIVSDIGLNGRKERLIPYIITIIAMVGTGFFLHSRMAPSWLVMFYVGGGVAGLVNTLINFGWKISAHATGIAGVVALLVRIMHDDPAQHGVLTWIMVTIALSGMLGSARLWLRRHTLCQVLAGYVVGFCAVFLMTLIDL